MTEPSASRYSELAKRLLRLADWMDETSPPPAIDAHSERNMLREAAVAVSEQQRWIPVTERMPDAPGPCLIYGDFYTDGFKRIAWSFFNSQKEWCDTIGYFTKRVTHWQPLPAPPSERPESYKEKT